jgi:hypothetical protein
VVHFNTLTNTKKGFVIGGEMGYVSFFEIGQQMGTTNTLNFQVKFPDQTKTTIHQISCSNNDNLLTIISAEDNK